jgi:hypothetical protein
MLTLVAIEVWIRVIRLDGVQMSGRWVRDWLTGDEAWEPFRWWSGRTADGHSVHGMF